MAAEGTARRVELSTGARSDFRFVVRRASGIVSAQLGVSVAEALLRLRAYAVAHDQRIGDVAGEVVARRLRLEGC